MKPGQEPSDEELSESLVEVRKALGLGGEDALERQLRSTVILTRFRLELEREMARRSMVAAIQSVGGRA